MTDSKSAARRDRAAPVAGAAKPTLVARAAIAPAEASPSRAPGLRSGAAGNRGAVRPDGYQLYQRARAVRARVAADLLRRLARRIRAGMSIPDAVETDTCAAN